MHKLTPNPFSVIVRVLFGNRKEGYKTFSGQFLLSGLPPRRSSSQPVLKGPCQGDFHFWGENVLKFK